MQQRGSTGSPAGVSLQVVPRVVRMEWANGIHSARDRVFDLALEWRVVNGTGQTILVETVIGEGSANIGSAFSAHSNLNNARGNLMEDTFKKSQARLEPELRRL